MALLFMDGFEHYVSADLGEKYEYVAAANVGSAQARTGTYSGYGTFGKAVNPTGTTCIVGLGWRATGGGSYIVIGKGGFGSTSYWQISLTVEGTGALTVKRNDSTTIATAPAGTFKLNVWNHLEFKVVVHDSTGTVDVKVNGATVLSGTGLDTQGVAATGWDTVEFRAQSVAYFDDIYLCDGNGSQNNDFLGECRVVTMLPSTGNGSNTDFTCSSSTDHGALVDEAAPNDDTDYVYSSTVNHVDSWNYPALGYTGTIKGVQMSLSAKKTDSGTRAIAAVTRPASTNRVHGTNHYLGTSYAYWMSIWELNPEDSAAWEVADVDGAEFGAKVTV